MTQVERVQYQCLTIISGPKNLMLSCNFTLIQGRCQGDGRNLATIVGLASFCGAPVTKKPAFICAGIEAQAVDLADTGFGQAHMDIVR